MSRWDLNNEKDIKTIKTRAVISFKKLTGSFEGSEDCAQEILAYFLSGKGKKQTISQAVIDYLRRDSGRKGKRGYSERVAPKQQICENYVGGYSELALVDRLSADRIIESSRHWQRAVMKLFFKWGYHEVEIADLFGVSPTRVNHWLTGISKRISTKIKSEESRERQRKMAQMVSKETKGIGRRVEQFTFERMEIGQSWPMASYNESSF